MSRFAARQQANPVPEPVIIPEEVKQEPILEVKPEVVAKPVPTVAGPNKLGVLAKPGVTTKPGGPAAKTTASGTLGALVGNKVKSDIEEKKDNLAKLRQERESRQTTKPVTATPAPASKLGQPKQPVTAATKPTEAPVATKPENALGSKLGTALKKPLG